MNEMVIIILVSALIIGVGVMIAIGLNKFSPKSLDKEKYQTEWLRIEQGVKPDEVPSLEIAIVKADKLVDLALKEKNFSGSTMAERMKSAKNIWSDANELWRAHKLRNQIVHEQSVFVDYKLTKVSLSAFKKALKDLGAI